MILTCTLLALSFVGTLLYWFLTQHYKTWQNQNIPEVPNPIPGFGHMLPVITLREHRSAFVDRIYKSSKASMVGMYFMRRPALVLRDPELIKCVLQSNFPSFRNIGITLDEKSDPIMSRNPFFATDPHVWKESRTRTISNFSGKKMGHLFVFFEAASNELSGFIERKIKENGGSYDCNLKTLFERYTGEIVANTAFGIQGHSFVDNPTPMSFSSMAKVLFQSTWMNDLKIMVILYLPAVASFLRLGFLDKNTEAFLRENLKVVLKERKESNVKPNDFLQFSIDSSPDENMDQIIADLIIFYVDTFETASMAMGNCLYQLSLNKEVQKKLREHVLSVTKDTGGVVTLEAVKKMNYLEQVIMETLRTLTPVGSLNRVCTEECTLTGSDGLTCTVQPGDYVYVPTRSLHKDPAYWTDPEVFDPDRFSPENQAARHKFVFLGFGEGPRMCLGMRMALVIIKLAVAKLILKYSLEKSTTTKTPLQEMHGSIITSYEGGVWAVFKELKD